MTVSSKINSKDTRQLPGVFELAKTAIQNVHQDPGTIFGFAAWILIPTLGYFTIPYIPTIELANVTTSLCDTFVLLTSLAAYYAVTETLNKKKLDEIQKEIPLRLPAFFLLTILIAIVQIAGFFAIIIPGLIAITLLALARTIFIIEKTGIFAACKKSFELTKTRPFAILWRVIGGNLIIATIALICLQPILYLSEDSHLIAPIVTLLQLMLLPYIVSYEYALYVSLKNR